MAVSDLPPGFVVDQNSSQAPTSTAPAGSAGSLPPGFVVDSGSGNPTPTQSSAMPGKIDMRTDTANINTPDTVKNIMNAVGNPVGTISKLFTGKTLADNIGGDNPNPAPFSLDMARKALGEATEQTGNLALGVGVIKKGAEAVNAVKTAISDVGSKNLENRIFGLYNSSVGAKAKNLGDVTRVQPQRMAALKTMSDNLPNITLESGEEIPKNRYDLAQTLRQTKQAIWQKVSDLSGGATDAGAKIEMAPVVQKAVDDTVKGIGQDALKANPGLLKSLQQEATNVSQIGTTTPSRAQQYMASLNKELSPMFNKGQAVDYSVLDFKKNLVNHLNDATESAIEDTLNEPGYGALRDQYAALKSSEKEIIGSANKYLRQQGGQGGGISHPIVNLWSIEQLMEGGGHLLTGNPAGAAASLGRAAIIKGASKVADFLKDPDMKISKMFDLLKKYNGGIKTGEGSVPVDALGSPKNNIPPNIPNNAPLNPGMMNMPSKIAAGVGATGIGLAASSDNANAYGKIDINKNADTNGLLNDTRQKMYQLNDALLKDGIHIRVVSGFRNQAAQDKLYAQGRTLPGRIVTNARHSMHNQGKAFDVVVMKNGKVMYNPIYYKKIGEEAKKLGLTWGGDFKHIKDYGHIQNGRK